MFTNAYGAGRLPMLMVPGKRRISKKTRRCEELAIQARSGEKYKRGGFESGNTTLEFIGFLILLGLPIMTYFAQLSHNASEELSNQELFREVRQIIKTGEDFNQSITVAKRYLTLHNSRLELVVTCISGDCPKRESTMKLVLKSQKFVLEGVFSGSQWG